MPESKLPLLPPEIIEQILAHLPPQSLVSLSRTCGALQVNAENDLLWERLLRLHISPRDFPDQPFPAKSYRDLYISHHPHWFLPRYKLWFSNEPHTGKIMLVRFDPRRGCIEGYRLLAEQTNTLSMIWSHATTVMIHFFQPHAHLWQDGPLLKLDYEPSTLTSRQGWWEGEIQMKIGPLEHATSASFFLTRDIPPSLQDRSMDLWPPPTIPNMPRVRAVSQDKFRGKGHKPQTYDEISQTTFRMRQWSQFSMERAFFGVRVGEEASTWSTIDPILYTPTTEKPYQGIFVGDYAGHGCEFLLVTQTEKAPDPPVQLASSIYYNHLSPAAFQAIADMERIRPREDLIDSGDDMLSGAIEAIKITGDVNIPRGQHTFIADDIGPNGLVRIADEPPFRGARIVKSRGHVANRGFQQGKIIVSPRECADTRRTDEFIPSQLILISPDRLAQYWIVFGHVSHYQRVDIDEIMDRELRS